MRALERTPIDNFLDEAQRQIDVCNGCRYCEGYCAVFPAMERIPNLALSDVSYLATLCHDCRACYQACMYTPPHTFAIDIPRLMSTARTAAYERYARPRRLARAFNHGPAAVAKLTTLGVIFYVCLAWLAGNATHLFGGDRVGGFYEVIPYSFMLVPHLLVSLFIVGVIGWGGIAFLIDVRRDRTPSVKAWLLALREAATLRWLDGGGDSCYYPTEDAPSDHRRVLHHLTAYGFLLAFVSTSLAAIYQEALHQDPPFPVAHPVVITGLLGGLGMVSGTTGLLIAKLHLVRPPSLKEAMLNSTFLVALDVAAATGLLLLALRGTSMMPLLLIIHLGSLVPLYLTAPYGKSVHIAYRLVALALSATDRMREDGRAGGLSQPTAPPRPAEEVQPS